MGAASPSAAVVAVEQCGFRVLRRAADVGGEQLAAVAAARRHRVVRRAVLEAMQAAELAFATLLGVLFLGEAWPRGYALFGALAIIVGIALFGWTRGRGAAGHDEAVRAMRCDRSTLTWRRIGRPFACVIATYPLNTAVCICACRERERRPLQVEGSATVSNPSQSTGLQTYAAANPPRLRLAAVSFATAWSSRTSIVGATPNMRRQVRLRWAESAKPACCAASVHEPPVMPRATA